MGNRTEPQYHRETITVGDGQRGNGVFVADDGQEAGRLQDRLRQARDETLTLLDSHLEDSEFAWADYLKPTAEHLHSALRELSEDGAFWEEVARAESASAFMTNREVYLLREIMDSDLARVLEYMNYTPPPPSAELAADLQLSLEQVLSEPDKSVRVEMTKHARRCLSLYLVHLRNLITEGDKSSTGLDRRITHRKVIAAIKKGAAAALPAIVAAGITAALFPPAGVVGVGGALGVAVTASVKQLTQCGVQAAASCAVGTVLAEEETLADPAVARDLSLAEFESTVMDLTNQLSNAREPTAEQLEVLGALSISATRAGYAVLQATAEVNDSQEHLIRAPLLEALAVLRDLRDLNSRNSETDANDINKRLTASVERIGVLPRRRQRRTTDGEASTNGRRRPRGEAAEQDQQGQAVAYDPGASSRR